MIGKDLLPVCTLPLMTVSLAIRRLFSSMSSPLFSLGMISFAVVCLLREPLPVLARSVFLQCLLPVTLKVCVLSQTDFSTGWERWVYFDSLHGTVAFLRPLIREATLSPVRVLTPLPRIGWLCMEFFLGLLCYLCLLWFLGYFLSDYVTSKSRTPDSS